MKKVLLSDWFKVMLKVDLEDYDINELNEDERIRFVEFSNEFWKFEGEDREIVLEDLKRDEGILYKKMCDWNESEVVIELELNMICWEYSIEDYFRDMFDKNGFEKDEFNMFELRDINKMMYGEDYNDDDWNYEE
jgi:hypothetical protein